VAFAGSRFQAVRAKDGALEPVRALVLRLKRHRLDFQRRSVQEGLRLLESFCEKHALLSRPFETNYAVSKAMAATLRRLGGGHTFGAETSAELVQSSLARFGELLQLIDLSPFRQRRQRHRISEVVLPKLFDAVSAYLGDEAAAASGGSTAAAPATTAEIPSSAPAKALSESELQEEELVLLDLLHAPDGSFLHSLANVMTRVENLSHVLAWACFDEAAKLANPLAVEQSDLRIVSLPRLKLTFQAREVGGSVRLYSVDHADLFITNERNETSALLKGIPHSLLLSDTNGKIDVLVPAWKPFRPAIAAEPFSTELVLGRNDSDWYNALDQPYYIYPVRRRKHTLSRVRAQATVRHRLSVAGACVALVPVLDHARFGALPPPSALPFGAVRKRHHARRHSLLGYEPLT
jgi:hypothetical protein